MQAIESIDVEAPWSERTRPVYCHGSPAQPVAADVGTQVKAFAKDLDLNEEQQAAVKKILERRRQQSLRIMRSGSGPDGVGRLQALQLGTVEQIRAVLNDEQKKKYDPLAVRQAGPAPGQKSVEDWLKVTTPQWPLSHKGHKPGC